VKNHNIYSKVQNCLQPYIIYSFLFSFLPSTYRAQSMTHVLFFLLICTKLSYTLFASPNSFMLVYNLTVSFTKVCTYLFEVDIIFFLYRRDLEMFVHNFFLKVDRVKSSANPSLIPQNLPHYQSKVISNFLNQNPLLGSMGCKGLSLTSST
jgi:hypothetical protein